MINFDKDFRMLINGQLETSSEFCEAINPANEKVLATVPQASFDQLDAAIAAAKDTFPAWRDQSWVHRQKVVAAIGRAIAEHADEFKRLLISEQGKGRSGADWEVDGSAHWCAAIAQQSLEVELVEQGDGRTVETRRTPIGVVGAITPWNFPILLAVWKIAPALLTGNTMVLKPSPFTSLSTLKLGEVLKDIVPAGVLNIISGGNELGAKITGHKDVGKISFTGSTATGRKIMKSASGNLKRLTLELGGNDPAIVLPDVDPKVIAPELFWAAFQNSAQFCVAAKRVYIHADIYNEVRDELVKFAQTVKVGDGSKQGTDLGPIQNAMQFEKVRSLIENARKSGIDFALGGEIEDGPGYFVPITIVDNPPDDAPVVTEEAFGPVLPLLKFEEIDDVIARANNTEYGLAASVWSNDLLEAKRIAEKIEAGTVWINEIHIFAPHIAFGGHKQSGFGVENAQEGLAEYTNPQTIMTNERRI